MGNREFNTLNKKIIQNNENYNIQQNKQNKTIQKEY